MFYKQAVPAYALVTGYYGMCHGLYGVYDGPIDRGAKMMNCALKTRNCVSKSHKNEEFCVTITQKIGLLYLK